MTAEKKKELINKRLSEGDKRSYNEIAADLELQIWAERFNPPEDQTKKDEKSSHYKSV